MARRVARFHIRSKDGCEKVDAPSPHAALSRAVNYATRDAHGQLCTQPGEWDVLEWEDVIYTVRRGEGLRSPITIETR